MSTEEHAYEAAGGQEYELLFSGLTLTSALVTVELAESGCLEAKMGP